MAKPSTKELVKDVADKLPPNATVEEAMERLYFLAKIERGVAQADAGQTLSNDDVRRRLGF